MEKEAEEKEEYEKRIDLRNKIGIDLVSREKIVSTFMLVVRVNLVQSPHYFSIQTCNSLTESESDFRCSKNPD